MLDFSRPGKATDTALLEWFNGHFRDEGLNANWFLSLADARSKIDVGRQDTTTRAVLTQRWRSSHPGKLRWQLTRRLPNEPWRLTL